MAWAPSHGTVLNLGFVQGDCYRTNYIHVHASINRQASFVENNFLFCIFLAFYKKEVFIFMQISYDFYYYSSIEQFDYLLKFGSG